MPDALRAIAAAVLAAPVLARIYLSILVRSRRGRIGLLGAIVVVGAVGAVATSLPDAAARPPSATRLVPAGSFRDVRVGGGAAEDAPTFSPTPAMESTPEVTPESTPAPESTPTPAPPASLPAPEPPSVVRFRPIGGTQDVDRSADLSVRFSTAMDAAAAPFFSAGVNDRPIEGSVQWAEGDTVLVLDPTTDLPYGARVVLRVTAGARSADGLRLAASRAISFTVEPKPEPEPTPESTVRPTAAAAPASPDRAGWTWPLLGAITQRFGESLTPYGYHYGIDIDGSTGDPVRAARSGTVTVAGHYDNCGGNEVHIEHSDGLVSWYRHLSRIDVAVGDRVSAGDLVGRVGNTGCSLGSHLHFAVSRGTTFLDPLGYLPAR